MTISLHSQFPRPVTGLALILILFQPVLGADESAAAAQAGARAADRTAEKIRSYKINHSEMTKEEVKSALAEMDAELDNLSKLEESAPTLEQRAEVQTHYDVLNQRRKEFGREFTRVRFEAFKADLQAELVRVTAWLKETFSNKSDTAEKEAEPSRDHTNHRAESNEANKTGLSATALLAQLDNDLGQLTVKIDTLGDPDRKAELKRRLGAYRERRNELNGQFDQVRYDALCSDVRAEWNQFTD